MKIAIDTINLLLFASLSRLIVIVLAICLDYIITDHKAIDVEIFINNNNSSYLSTFIKWDSAHYLNISKYHYKRLQQYAFHEFYPFVIRIFSNFINRYVNSLEHINDDGIYILSGLLISNISFVINIIVFNKLLDYYNTSNIVKKTCLLIYCFNPASIFFTSIYTESVYMLISWIGLLFVNYSSKYNNIIYLLLSLICFYISTSIRSNGLLFIVYYIPIILQLLKSNRYIYSLLLSTIIIFSFLIPLYLHDNKSKLFLCDSSYQTMDNFELNLKDEICQRHSYIYLPYHSIYSKIQYNYWNVGLFAYYQFKQIPNFILASPIIIISIYTIIHHYRQNNRYRNIIEYLLMNPLILHLLLLILVGVLYSNIQIITRLILSSNPIVYISIGELLLNGKRWQRYSTQWFLISYFIIGILLHYNFYPWT